MRHVAVGTLVLVVSTWALMAATYTFHEMVGLPWVVSIVAGTLVAFVIFGLDVALTATPLKKDSATARMAVLLLRGSVSVAIGLVISHATIMLMYQPTIDAIVQDANQQRAAKAAKDVEAASLNRGLSDQAKTKIAGDQRQIEAADTKLAQALSANDQAVATADNRLAAAQQELESRKQAWTDDRVCIGDTGRAANGDACGRGDVADQLQQAYQDSLTNGWPAAQNLHDTTVQQLARERTAAQKLHEDSVRQLNQDIAAQQKTVTDSSDKLGAEIDQARQPALEDDGLPRQAEALWTLLKQDPFSWLWFIFFVVIDLAVGLMKAVLPESEFDRRRRTERERSAKLEGEIDNAPIWSSTAEQIAENEAAIAIVRSTARRRRVEAADAQKAAREAARAGNGMNRRVAAPIVASAVLLVLVAALMIVPGSASTQDDASSGPGATAALSERTDGAASSSPATTSAISDSAVAATSNALSVPVTPTSAIALDVPGVGSLSAAKGAFSANGTMTVTPTAAQPPAADGIVVADFGVDVTFSDTALVQPMSLHLVGSAKPGPNAIPVLAHRADDGKWDYRPATFGADGKITVDTQAFSLNIAGWISDGLNWVGNKLASAVGGRTSPLSCSGAPSWLHLAEGHSDLVHVCAKDAGLDSNGNDRAEIQIKSNRGVSIEVSVPGDPQYVWVENQSDRERKPLMKYWGKDPNRTVILQPGMTMTVGYTQSINNQDIAFWVDGNTWLAFGDTVARQLLGLAAGYDKFDKTGRLFVSYLIIACGFDLQVGFTGVDAGGNLGDRLKCLKDQFAGGLQSADPTKIIQKVYENTAEAAEMSAAVKGVAKSIPVAAAIDSLWPFFLAGWGNVADKFKDLGTGGQANQVSLAIDKKVNPPNTLPAAVTTPQQSDDQGPASQAQTTPAAPAPETTTEPAPESHARTTPETTTKPAPESHARTTVHETDTVPPTIAPPTATATATPSVVPQTTPTQLETATVPAPIPYEFFANYGPAVEGIAMCRGNAGRRESMPGGTALQAFTADAHGTIDSATVQIDPDATVTATAVLTVDGVDSPQVSQIASGDVTFSFTPTTVHKGSAVQLRITFTASSGKIITIYSAGSPSGTLTVTNTCPDGAPTFTRSDSGLRATVSGTS
jgi:hypothetical protein